MRITGGIERENDRLVQVWASMQKSYVSESKKNIVGHHYYSRHHRLLRWDLRNIIPLTYDEHKNLHSGILKIEIKNPFRKQYLDNMVNKDYRDYLLENGLTDRDFAELCNKKLKETIYEELQESF